MSNSEKQPYLTQAFLRVIHCMKFSDFCKLLNESESSSYAEEKYQFLKKDTGRFLMECDEKRFEAFAVWAGEEHYRQSCRKVTI